MNRKNIAGIIADPTALVELRKCTSVSELVARLNQAGAECTREEGLRFLRTWENLETDNEAMEMEDLAHVTGGGGLMDIFNPLFNHGGSPKWKLAPDSKPGPLTIETILNRMNM